MGRVKEGFLFDDFEAAAKAVLVSHRLKREEPGVVHFPYFTREKNDAERFIVKMKDGLRYFVFVASVDINIRPYLDKKRIRRFAIKSLEKAIWGSKLPPFN